MKNPFIALVLLATLFMTTLSMPVEKGGARGDSVLRHSSSHRGLSHRIRKALAKRSRNLTFTPIDSVNDFMHVEYGAPTQESEAANSRFSATLLKLVRDNDIAERSSGDDAQVVLRSPDIYGGRHVIISTPHTLVQTLKQKGVLQDNIPQYVGQNVLVADPNTGDQYQLVPDSNPEEHVSIDSSTITITLKSI